MNILTTNQKLVDDLKGVSLHPQKVTVNERYFSGQNSSYMYVAQMSIGNKDWIVQTKVDFTGGPHEKYVMKAAKFLLKGGNKVAEQPDKLDQMKMVEVALKQVKELCLHERTKSKVTFIC